ncbi:MAG: hypothetical protein QF371_03395 [Flavobacteriales bacterium]|nr:hypothetical protein [Flavobacteriales bacterium]
MVELDLQREWNNLILRLETQFGDGVNMDAILFLIGVQELGQGHRDFKKTEKIDLIHIAVCRLLSQYGHYRYEGMDKEGWPHYRPLAKLPNLNPKQQSLLMKEAVLEYFKNSDLIN